MSRKPRDYWFQQVADKTAKAWAKKFFRDKLCVLRRTGPRGCAWHHLDENSENNARVGNLVPLSGDLNEAIDTARKEYLGHLRDDLSTEQIRLAARRHWSIGDFAYSYGANRLGAFLERNYRNDPSESLTFAAEALHSLRPLWSEWLAIDTMERSVQPLVEDARYKSRLSADSLAAICKEVASWFLAIHHHAEFSSWRTLGSAIARVSDLTDPDEPRLTDARLLQHQGILLYQAGNLTESRRAIENADGVMRELRYSHGISNNYQYLARIDLQECSKRSATHLDDPIKRIHELEREFGKIEPWESWGPSPRDLEFWTGVGLMQLKAEVFYRKGHMGKWKAMQKGVASLLAQKRVKVMEVFPGANAVMAFASAYDVHAADLAPFRKIPRELHPQFVAAAKILEDRMEALATTRFELTLSN